MTDIDAVKRRIVNRRVNPLLGDLPEKFVSFKPHQIAAVRQIVDLFDNGAQFVFLDAPTGAGKTVIGEVVRRELQVDRALYCCTTKSLQDQFLGDFSYAKVLKGRSNYPTQKYPRRFHPNEYQGHVSCGDCTWTTKKPNCQWCEYKVQCPYEVAKKIALGSELAVLNTAYFLAECNNIGKFAGRDLVIVDEADTLEAQLMGYISVELSQRRMEQYKIEQPRNIGVSRVDGTAAWVEWLNEVIPKLKGELAMIPEVTDVRGLREAKYLGETIEKLSFVLSGLVDGESWWVYEGKEGKGAAFRPSRVSSLGWDYFWKHGKRFLAMSATPISCQEIAESTGLRGSFEVVKMPSTFPVSNRKVYYKPVADMARRHSSVSWPVIAEALREILDRHPNDRVLVHTVSYDLTRYLRDYLRQVGLSKDRDVVSYENAGGRQTALVRYGQRANSIMLAPSMDRGIDLPGDLCRVQVIVKVPFPFLDRVTSARLHSRNGQQWYTIQTIRTIVQMCGRAVRSEEDFAATYILDTQFEAGVWSRGRGLFPSWFVEAIDWSSERRGPRRHEHT